MVSPAARLWRTSSLLILTVAVTALVGAVAVLLIAVAAMDANTPPALRRYVMALVITAGMLLALVLFCVGVLVIRYLAFRSAQPTVQHKATAYVNAWELAGRRMQTPPPDEDGDDESDS